MSLLSPTYQDVVEFRTTDEAVHFAKGWLQAQSAWEVSSSDYHINLLAWTQDHPVQVLGIVLNLIDQAGAENDLLGDAIGLGPVDWLLCHCPDSFGPIIKEAARSHPGFALYTTFRRSNPEDPESIRLGKISSL